MEEQQTKPNRACDGCRIRKRKCDSKLPYCSNCIKTSVRDENGNPICQYSIETKKRGPKKGYKGILFLIVESLLQRLETLEAILSPLSKQESTKNWADSLASSSDAQPLRHRAYSVVSVQSSVGNEVPLGLNEEEFELHLIRLGLQYCNLSSNYRLSLLLGEEFLFHQKSVHASLRMALCANGLFYSQHPNLSSMISSDESKTLIVERFLKQAEAMLPKKYSNEIEMTDSIRALLVIVDVYFAIGQAENGNRINTQVHSLIDAHQLFEPCIFNPVQKFGTTVDDLLLDASGKTKKPSLLTVLSDEDIKERFQLWEECLVIDTFSSMATAEPLQLNEIEYPTVFRNKALEFTNLPGNFAVPFELSPLSVPHLARNSVWCGTSYASSFDNVREMTCLAALHFSSGLVKFRLALIRNVRRAMRYSRETAVGAVHSFPNDSIDKIHGDLLLQFETIPTIFLPFKSMDLFAPGKDVGSLAINKMWRSFISLNHDLLLFFASFAYLHLPIINYNDKVFKLSTNAQNAYASIDVLFVILRITVFTIQSAYTVLERSSNNLVSPEVLANVDNCSLPTEIPAPGLASIEAAVSIYIISSSCLEGCKTHPAYLPQVSDMILLYCLPAIRRIGVLKPLAMQYYTKLRQLLPTFNNPSFNQFQ